MPRTLRKHAKIECAVDDPKDCHSLPFTASKDGVKLDVTIHETMRNAGVKFQTPVQCNRMLQTQQRGECADIMPSVGIDGPYFNNLS